MRLKIKRGLGVALDGAPEQVIDRASPVRSVALVGLDYNDLKPSLSVSEGEQVRLGQTLFTDRRCGDIRHAAPASGRVLSIRRGPKRKLLSIVIGVTSTAQAAAEFDAHRADDLRRLSASTVRETLLSSGLWTAFRARPFSAVPLPDIAPRAILITAIDTNPLAADPAAVIAEREEAFRHGIAVVSRLAQTTFLCKGPALRLPARATAIPGVVTAEFVGPHPAGLPGTHIEHLAPASEHPDVWYIGYQDVIAIGELFTTGRLSTERVVAIGGPGVARPRLVRAQLGASLEDLLRGEVQPNARIITGSALSGRASTPHTAYLGRYDTQVTVLDESSTAGRTSSTAMHGWSSGMLAIERLERVWPFDTPVLPLLRALLVNDGETAAALGCLGLDEEDVALCSYVCPAKQDYGAALRSTLNEIRRGY